MLGPVVSAAVRAGTCLCFVELSREPTFLLRFCARSETLAVLCCVQVGFAFMSDVV